MRNCVILYLLFSLSVYAQNRKYTEMYNLDFHDGTDSLFEWYRDRGTDLAIIIHDSIEMKNSKHPLGIFQPRYLKLTLPINVRIHQNILLPKTHCSSSVKLSLSCKGQNLLKAYMACSTLNSCGDTLVSDTVSLLGSDNWKEYLCKFPLKESVILNVQIGVVGNYDKFPQKLLLDRLDIFLDDTHIDMFSVQDSYGSIDSLITSPLPLSFENPDSYSQIKLFDKSKVLALGETFHGSATFTKVAAEIMKYQVMHNHCKLILLERPITQSLLFNKYVHGDNSICLDSLLYPDKFPLGEELKEFMNWLKDYNQSTTRKVSLYGIDVEPMIKEDLFWVCEYLLAVAKNKNIAEIRSFCCQLIDMDSSTDIVVAAQQIPELREALSQKEYSVFIRTLEYLKGRFEIKDDKSSNIFLLRDSLMNSYTNFLIDELVDLSKEKVVIYTHLCHAAFSCDPTYLNKMLGTYLRQKYKDDYACIALTVGEGPFLTIDSNKFVIKSLNPPKLNSIEYAMDRLGYDYCYANVCDDSYSGCKIRNFGSTVNQNVYSNLSSLPSFMSGIIYVKQSRPFFIPKDLLNKKIKHGYINRFWKNYRRFKRGGVNGLEDYFDNL